MTAKSSGSETQGHAFRYLDWMNKPEMFAQFVHEEVIMEAMYGPESDERRDRMVQLREELVWAAEVYFLMVRYRTGLGYDPSPELLRRTMLEDLRHLARTLPLSGRWSDDAQRLLAEAERLDAERPKRLAWMKEFFRPAK